MGEPAREENDDVSIRIPTAPDPAEALRAIKEKGPSAPVAVDDPRTQEEYSFHVEFKAANGQEFAGSFTNRILTPQLALDRGLLMTQMAAGVPFSMMDDETVEYFRAAAHMQLSLVKTPEWWSLGREGVSNMTLFNKVYGEVVAHEVTFLGPFVDPKARKS
jgi:hypothetical protein